jgi:signal transduction histidine kinase
MKTIIKLFLLLLLTQNNLLSKDNKFEVTIFEDKKNDFTIKTPPSLDLFINNFSSFGLKNYNIWSLTTLNNNLKIKREFICIANFNHDTKDVLIYKYDNLGVQKKITIDDYKIFTIELEPNEAIKILTLVNPKSIIQSSWIIEESQYFYTQSLYIILNFGIYYSLIVFLLIYNITSFLNSKNILFLFYSVLLIFTSINFNFYNNIFFKFSFIELDLIQSSFITSIISLILCIIKINFNNTFQNNKNIILALSFQIIVIILALISCFYSINIYILNFIIFIIYLFSFYTILFLLIDILNKNTYPYYFTLGIIIYLIQLFGSFLNYNNLFLKSFALPFIINIFIIIGIIHYIKLLKIKNEQHKKLLIEQSLFYSLGQSLSHILHQWKIPLYKLSNHINLIETLLLNRPEELNKVIHEKLPLIKFCLEHIDSTINDFSNFSNFEKLEKFSPLDTTLKILFLLDAKIKLMNIKINLYISKELEILGHEHIFSNVLLILINNAVEAFQFNSYYNKPYISIGLSNNNRNNNRNNNLLIFIKDNAGGIKIKPIEKSFEYYSSTKEKGSGIGLPLVKLLVEEKLKGTISAENINKGALFKIVISHDTKEWKVN